MILPFNNLVRVKILDQVRKTDQVAVLEQFIRNQYSYSQQDIENYQQVHFDRIFQHHYKYNPAYRAFLAENGFVYKKEVSPADVPVVSKDFFRNHADTHFVKEYLHTTKYSGGSTGVPLPVRLSKESIDNFWPAIWRAFDVYGIRPCDRIMMIAGPSLFNNRSFKRRVYDSVSRFKVVSAYELNDARLEAAYQYIRQHKVEAIYGYTSSVLVFLQFLEKNNLRLQMKGIFTASETFIPAVRPLAKEYCGCDVIDTYGANDGGVSAFECQHHTGYHLTFERCLVEIIDHEIILTDLMNTTSPFIRYRVGDHTESTGLIKERCSCGRSLFRLSSISGKVNQFIDDVDGKVNTQFFTEMFKLNLGIRQFQVRQREGKLYVNIIHDQTRPDEHYRQLYTDNIRRRFKMPFEMVFGEPIQTLQNMKTPILIKE